MTSRYELARAITCLMFTISSIGWLIAVSLTQDDHIAIVTTIVFALLAIAWRPK